MYCNLFNYFLDDVRSVASKFYVIITSQQIPILRLFLKDFIHFQRGEGREGEKHQCVIALLAPYQGPWPATQACALTGNQTSDPLVPSTALTPLNRTSQDPILRFFSPKKSYKWNCQIKSNVFNSWIIKLLSTSYQNVYPHHA